MVRAFVELALSNFAHLYTTHLNFRTACLVQMLSHDVCVLQSVVGKTATPQAMQMLVPDLHEYITEAAKRIPCIEEYQRAIAISVNKKNNPTLRANAVRSKARIKSVLSQSVAGEEAMEVVDGHVDARRGCLTATAAAKLRSLVRK